MVFETRQATVSILCVGNALHGDDGLGEAVFEAMRQKNLPASVRLVRMPFVGANAVPHVEGCDRVLVVDAIQGFGEPGSVHTLAPDQIALENDTVSHGAGLGKWLAELPAWLDVPPDIEIIGVEAQDMTPFSPGLSYPVRSAVSEVCDRLLERTGDE